MIPGLAPTENARVMDADDIEGMVEAYVQAPAAPWTRISPILYRHTSMEDVPERHRLRYQRRAVPALTDAGVNAFDITAGMQCCFELMTPPTCMPKA